jgi:hypothetical protein
MLACDRKIDNIGNLRVEEGQGENKFRPRSVSAPQPANTIDYQQVNFLFSIHKMMTILPAMILACLRQGEMQLML